MVKKANLFMIFLLCFNLLIITSMGTLYWQFWHGTAVGAFIRSPWWLIANQIIGLLIPMFIFKMLGVSAGGLRPWSLMFPDATGRGSFAFFANSFLVIGITMLLQPVMMLVSAISSLFMSNPVPYLFTELSALPIPMALVIIALTPAICEEWVFRGYILDMYSEKRIAIAALVNGLSFGIIHLNLHQFFYAFAMGVVFAFFVYFTRSLFYAILAHFAVNSFQYVLGTMAIGYEGFVQSGVAEAAETGRDELLMAITGLAQFSIFTLPAAVGLFYLLIKFNDLRDKII